jgi:hypothetical protein
MPEEIGDPWRLVIAKARQLGYAQGWMDAIALIEDHNEMESLRMVLAGEEHACYYSMLGPFCVVCHKDLPR